MNKKNKKSFVPKDKPKSWVVGILSAIIGFIIAGPIMIIGASSGFNFIKGLGIIIFVTCSIIFALSWIFFTIGMVSGKYRNIQEQEWNQQLW